MEPHRLAWLPNALSFSRLAAAPAIGGLVGWGFVVGSAPAFAAAALLYAASAATDWLDGWLARTLSAQSALGAKLDLWGDKLLVGCAMAGLWIGPLCAQGQPLLDGIARMPLWALGGAVLMAATTGRDLVVTRLRARAEARGAVIPASWLAKIKTAVIMFGQALALAGLAMADTVPAGQPFAGPGLSPGGAAAAFGGLLIAGGAALSVWTAIAYVKAAR